MSAELEARVRALEDLVQRLTQAFLAPPTPAKQSAPAATTTETAHPLDKTERAIETAKQVGQTTDAFGEKKPATQTTIAEMPKRNLIAELQDGMKRINVSAQVMELGVPHEVSTAQGPTETTYAVIADESGRIKLSLWGEQVKQIKVSDNVTVGGGYVSSYKGELQLNVGKWGKLTVV